MNIRKIALALIGMLFVTALQAQNSENYKQVTFQTNGTCTSCKNKIEHALAYEKGVKDVNYDLATSKVTVLYNVKKTNTQKLQKAIFETGYQAEIVTEKKEGCGHACGNNNSGHSCGNSGNSGHGCSGSCSGHKPSVTGSSSNSSSCTGHNASGNTTETNASKCSGHNTLGSTPCGHSCGNSGNSGHACGNNNNGNSTQGNDNCHKN